MSDEWPWAEKQPVFTTNGEKGGSVTRVPHGVALTPLRPGFLVLVLGFTISFGLMISGVGLVFASMAEEFGPAAWWWLALGIPSGLLTVFLLSGMYVTGTELIMRNTPRNMIILTGTLAGTAIGLSAIAGWWSWRASDIGLHPQVIKYDGWNHHQLLQADLCLAGAAIAAIACLVIAVIALRGAHRARGDVRRILRLRNSGSRHEGVVAGLPDTDGWNMGSTVSIRYRDQRGDHTRRVRINTTPSKIPVPGTPLIVFVGADDDLLIEIDPDHPLEYHPNSGAYETSSDGGGS
ncbi:hypothetical protein FB566_2337 [Stackebrandtia endophytica]|uniref:Uncharacterized protein n=1 Tax=Stackebrandtia endophytica TaxID=1496996 RepID=A0A543AW67_9ACTN|nr:hypothetical protein [Stackebrandtia endophytica]TQL76800.1 hypothetical protein FB566_2337 [Stackebrandtia endophytica]